MYNRSAAKVVKILSSGSSAHMYIMPDSLPLFWEI